MIKATLPTTAPLPSSLEHEHGRLLQRFRILVEQAKAGDYRACDTTWDVAASGLEAHMIGEEALLGSLEGEHQEAIARIRIDHARVRHALDELGTLVQLHAASPLALASLLRELTEHAAREEQTFYRWLEDGRNEPIVHEPSVIPLGIALGVAAGAIVGCVGGAQGAMSGAALGSAIGAFVGGVLDGDDVVADSPARKNCTTSAGAA